MQYTATKQVPSLIRIYGLQLVSKEKTKTPLLTEVSAFTRAEPATGQSL